MTNKTSKKAWLLRPNPHGINRINEFKTDAFIAIGWPGIGDLNGKSREEIKSILSGPPYNYNSLALGHSYATVDIFVNQMRIGDLILTPNGEDIYLGEIAGDYRFVSSKDTELEGYPHQRDVTWLTTTSRLELSKTLRNSLKVRTTTANLSEHINEISSLAMGDLYRSETQKSVTEYLSINYPLRPDCMISFEIPKDISREEAKRLSIYFETLYFRD